MCMVFIFKNYVGEWWRFFTRWNLVLKDYRKLVPAAVPFAACVLRPGFACFLAGTIDPVVIAATRWAPHQGREHVSLVVIPASRAHVNSAGSNVMVTLSASSESAQTMACRS